MNNYTNQNPYASPYAVASQTENVRAEFIRKTYTHLAIALAAFAGLEWLLFQSDAIKNFALGMTGGFNWLIVMAAFFGVSILANKWAMSNTSKQKQYMGLSLYVVAMSIVSLPLIVAAEYYGSVFAGKNLILNAAVITLAMVAGITTIAFTTKKDFSFLGGFLKIAFFIAIGAIILSIVFGFTLGIVFSAVMVIVMSASVLYETSNVIHHYNSNQYVAASLGLFASIVLLFWYILQMLMSLANND